MYYYFVVAIWSFSLGIIFTVWLEGFVKRRAMPYRYECHKEDCYFRASASTMDMVDRVATSHEESHETRT